MKPQARIYSNKQTRKPLFRHVAHFLIQYIVYIQRSKLSKKNSNSSNKNISFFLSKTEYVKSYMYGVARKVVEGQEQICYTEVFGYNFIHSLLELWSNLQHTFNDLKVRFIKSPQIIKSVALLEKLKRY